MSSYSVIPVLFAALRSVIDLLNHHNLDSKVLIMILLSDCSFVVPDIFH